MWNQEADQKKNPGVATLGNSVFVKGEITGSEDLTIDGQVEGRIHLPDHTLTVGPNATIVADLNAKVVIVFGSVTGTITARDKVELRSSASAEGAISCGRISVQEGAKLNGKVETKEHSAPKSKKEAA
ncbi:MAG TPA: polymer-forming cytoskeletal protein [Vicinamibacterales bacterium]|jgi:cytoskeletal protein CcmA (bactofilin family)